MEPIQSPVLRKPSGTIHISNPFSLVERKLLNTLLYDFQSRSTSLPSGEYEISGAEIRSAVGWDNSHDIGELRKALKKLVGTTVEWNEAGVDRSTTWAICTFLASARVFAKGNIRYRPNPEIVDQLNRPRIFARMQLLIQGRLGRKYSLILYEFLQDEICRAKGQPSSFHLNDVRIDYLQRLFGMTEENAGSYFRSDGYKHFKRQVLNPAVKEICDKTDLSVEMNTYAREGRRVVSLSFDIVRKEAFQLVLDLNSEEDKDLTGKAELMSQLVEQGVTDKQAKELVRRFDRDRIEGNIKYMFDEIKSGKEIQRRGGWLNRAIREDYRPNVSQAEELEQARTAERKRIDELKERRAETEHEFKQFQYDRARSRFAEMSKTFQTRRRNKFIKDIENNVHPGLKVFWRKQGWEHPAVDAQFFTELIQDPKILSQPWERNFDAYLLWRGEGNHHVIEGVVVNG